VLRLRSAARVEDIPYDADLAVRLAGFPFVCTALSCMKPAKGKLATEKQAPAYPLFEDRIDRTLAESRTLLPGASVLLGLESAGCLTETFQTCPSPRSGFT
jgi:hypothetical protein